MSSFGGASSTPPSARRGAGALRPLVACTTAGAALYVTRGVLDQVIAGDGAAVRVALLPPWQALLGLMASAALLLVLIDHLNAPRGTTTRRVRPALGDLALPLVTSGVLLLPYLPILPDRWPVLQILAGPLRHIVWLVVAAHVAWVLWQARLLTMNWLGRWSLPALAVGIGLATALAAGLAAVRLAGTPLFPSGDEPHYLVIAQSLWRDGDLKIENNHARRDYHEYYPLDLEPDYLTRGADGQIYPIHPVGLPVLLAPVYAAGGYRAVVALLVAFAAIAAGIAWWWVANALNAPGAATFAWAAVAGSAPFVFNAFTVYPEIACGLAVIVVLAVVSSPRAAGRGVRAWLVAGVACGAMPWLSTKYAPMSAALVLVALARAADPLTRHAQAEAAPLRARAARWLNRRAGGVLVPYALSLGAWAAFFYWIWGSPWPQAPYGSMTQTSPANLPIGAPGLLFDQEYGLLAVAPVYVLAATGWWTMWRAGGALRRQAVELAFVFAALLATVGSHQLWWGGTSGPARPLASGLLPLALPIAAAFRAAPQGSARRAAQHLLLWVSLGIAATLVLAEGGLLVHNARDGSSALLEWWLARWDVWTLAPSFVHRNAPVALAHTALWLAAATAAGRLLARVRTAGPGAAALAASLTFGGALIAVAVVMPWLPAYGGDTPRASLRARARLAALEAFDRRALPTALVFDPLRAVDATAVVPLLRLEVTPGLRVDSQPVRVVHNGRFTLPAGRYNLDVRFAEQAAAGPLPVALQLGRVGPPFESWMVDARPGGRWQTTLDLPIDASFVGLRATPELERAVAAVTITPADIVDAGARPRVPVMLSAARYHGVAVFLHDEGLYPETQGFWALGRRTSMATFAVADGRTAPVVVLVHSGPIANRVTFRVQGWEHVARLAAGTPVRIALPPPEGRVMPLTISTENGFSPRDVDPNSRDSRFLGAWIEIAGES